MCEQGRDHALPFLGFDLRCSYSCRVCVEREHVLCFDGY